MKSEGMIETLKCSVEEVGKEFNFDREFCLFLKEEDRTNPYMALNVDSVDILDIVE